MKRRILTAICGAFVSCAASAADVGVSIEFSQPGIAGRIDVGQYPPPVLLAPQPVLVAPPPPAVAPPAPIYMWVPPEHQRHWERYCHEYHACGHPVYFVDHDWYRQHVLAQAPRGRVEAEERHDREREREREYGHGYGHGE